MLDPEIELSFRRLVDAIAGPDSLPAGGAAGVTAIAMGAALGAKVVRLSPDRPSRLNDVEAQLDLLREHLMAEFAADCDAFTEVLAARRRPHDDPARADALQDAWGAATAAPTRVARLAADAESLLVLCTGSVNPRLAGDLTAALELVRAGRRIAEGNARENADHLQTGG